ncbi:MAG: EF2563 family selenium-dependent molybdenum hydroxylase system protein, partial [Eubacterium sp.]|nr:EF2563 family selenium-dependent molybdenum hydroxylase system protein [Candidatus Colimonas fimequi]
MIDKLVIVRGGGDLATGTIHGLWSAGFKVLVLETENPAAIRRQVSVCEAVYTGETVVEGMKARLVSGVEDVAPLLDEGIVPVMADPKGAAIEHFKPRVVVDAIIAKKNLGTSRDMAPVTIALGPGFEAGADVDYVVETKRGHDLGRIIREGFAVKNSGIPGNIAGYSKERVM